jgi:hypothetical protein
MGVKVGVKSTMVSFYWNVIMRRYEIIPVITEI